jgi:predicted transcriptional regulator
LLGEIADLLEKNRIKRIPIVTDNKLVGVVSRANVVQAVASCLRDKPATNRIDADVRGIILSRF